MSLTGPAVLFGLAALTALRYGDVRSRASFLQVSTMSAGLYVLPEGGVDHQEPHDQDELYYVVGSRATLQVADEMVEVGPGSVVYVRAHVEHRFLNIEEELSVLVFFSAAEPQ